jgi:cell division protein FtsX
MNKQIHPVAAIVIIALFIAMVGVFMWKNLPQSAPPGQGRQQSDLDLSKATKDPVQFQKEVQELLERDRAQRGGQ